MFFNDILVFIQSLEQHANHLRTTFQLLQQHQFYAKASKCLFGQLEVVFLGHTVSTVGVGVNPKKVQAMMEWPLPTNVKELQGFLGLTGYYR